MVPSIISAVVAPVVNSKRVVKIFDERPHRMGDFSWGKFHVTLHCVSGQQALYICIHAVVVLYLVQLNVQSYLPNGANIHPHQKPGTLLKRRIDCPAILQGSRPCVTNKQADMQPDHASPSAALVIPRLAIWRCDCVRCCLKTNMIMQ